MPQTLTVEATDLLDIYESTDDENVREQIVDLLVSTPQSYSVETLYPEVNVDIDAEQLTREVAGVEDAYDAVSWVRRETEGSGHVSTRRAHGDEPYVTRTDETPPGWEVSAEHNGGYYLQKR